MPAPHGQPYLVNIPLSETKHSFRNFSTSYFINSLGNRGQEADNEPIQVVFLGDSFTFGLFIDEKNTSAGLIRTKAAEVYGTGKIGIQNAAIAASGIADWIAFLEDYGRRLKPSIVVANLNYVSISRGYKHPLFKLDCDSESLTRTNKPMIDSKVPWPVPKRSLGLRARRWLNDHSQLFMTVRKAGHELLELVRSASVSSDDSSRLPNMPFEAMAIDKKELGCFVRASFKALKAAAEQAGGKLVVIDIGYRWQTRLQPEHSIDLTALDFVPQTLGELKVPYQDLTNQIFLARNKGQELEIPGDGHPNKNGYRLIAKGSWPFIRKQIDLLDVNR
jgi:hypothetical protein